MCRGLCVCGSDIATVATSGNTEMGAIIAKAFEVRGLRPLVLF